MALLLSLGGKYVQEIMLMVVANGPLRFEVRVQVELGGYQVAWTMDECGFQYTSIQTSSSPSSLRSRNC